MLSADRRLNTATNLHGPLPDISAINTKSVSAIYSGLTFCYWAPVQALSFSLLLSGSATQWPPDRRVPPGLRLEVIIMPTLHFRIAIVDPPGGTFSFQAAGECDGQSRASRVNYLSSCYVSCFARTFVIARTLM